MFRRKPRWLYTSDHVINLDHVKCFYQEREKVVAVCYDATLTTELHGITLDDIAYYLKHGKPRRRKCTE